MSRFGGDDWDPNFPGESDLWNANRLRCLRGRAGQAVLRELRDALLSLPAPRLIGTRLADEQGEVCTVGALALHRRTQEGQERAAVLADLCAAVQPDARWGDVDAWEAEQRTIELGQQLGLKIENPVAA